MKKTIAVLLSITLVLFFVILFSSALFAEPAGPKAPPASKPASSDFQLGELIDISEVMNRYFDSAKAAGEPATYYGLEGALREKYENIIKKLNAFEDRSTISVDVRYDEKARAALIDVAFVIRKENRKPAGSIDLNQLSSHFKKCAIPAKFQVEISGAYRFGIRDADRLQDLPVSDAMKTKVFYTLHHLWMTSTTNVPSAEEDGSGGFDPFPEGLKPQTFTMDGLEMTAVPAQLSFDYRVEFALRSHDGKRELSGEDLVQNRSQVSTLQRSAWSGTFTLLHNDAAGTLTLEASDDDVAKEPEAALALNGELTFAHLFLGKMRLSDVRLSFTGSARQARVRARAPMRALIARAPEGEPGKAADAGGAIPISGSYDFAAGVLTIDAAGGEGPRTIAGPLGIRSMP